MRQTQILIDFDKICTDGRQIDKIMGKTSVPPKIKASFFEDLVYNCLKPSD